MRPDPIPPLPYALLASDPLITNAIWLINPEYGWALPLVSTVDGNRRVVSPARRLKPREPPPPGGPRRCSGFNVALAGSKIDQFLVWQRAQFTSNSNWPSVTPARRCCHVLAQSTADCAASIATTSLACTLAPLASVYELIASSRSRHFTHASDVSVALWARTSAHLPSA